MDKIDRILVYSHGAGIDDPALLHAARLAKSNSASVELVDVIEEVPAYAQLATPSSWNLAGLVAKQAAKALEEPVRFLETQGIQAHQSVLVGKPAISISRHVQSGGFDLVIKTARPEETPQSFWYGTLADRLMRICTCPVWIVRSDRKKPLERIIVAIDPDESDEQQCRVNEQIVLTGAALADRFRAQIKIVHAWSAYGVSMLQKRMPPDQLQRYVADCEAAARDRIERCLAPLEEKLADAGVQLLRGRPPEAIAQYVAEQDADLIVIGTAGRSGVAGYLIGNTAEKLLRRIRTSLVVVKPEDFQSPVSSLSVDEDSAK